MILKIITNEIGAFIILVLFLAIGRLSLADKGTLAYVIIVSLFVGLYFFVFASLKVYAPSIFMTNGMYEVCIAYCEKTINGKYSLVNRINAPRLHNFFRICASYACIKTDDIPRAQAILNNIQEEEVLNTQLVQFRLIKATIKANYGYFKEANEELLTVKTGKLLEKHVPDILYMISMCYLELGIENERAENFSSLAFNLKRFNQDYKLNWVVSMYKCKHDLNLAIALLSEINNNFDELTLLGKQRHIFYYYLISKETGSSEKSDLLAKALKESFPKSFYLKQIQI